MATKYGFDLYGNVSWLFPYDIIALQVVFIALGILSIIRSVKTKEYKDIPSTVQEVITKGKWYILSDISIDFTNPDEMLFDIATDIAKWDEIAVG
jgi:hypothetical protein